MGRDKFLGKSTVGTREDFMVEIASRNGLSGLALILYFGCFLLSGEATIRVILLVSCLTPSLLKWVECVI